MSHIISERNSRLFVIAQFFQALWFVIPIWIVYYQGFLSTSQISFLVGWGYMVQLVGELPTGAFADLVGKRVTIIMSYVLTGIGIFFTIYAQNFTHFLLIETLIGIGTALFSGAQEALLYDSLKQDGKEKDFSKVMTRNGFWYQIGLMTATAAGGLMYTYAHYIPYVASAASSLMGAIFTWFMIEPRIDTEKFTLKNYLLQIKHGTRELVKTTETKLISSYYIAVGSITWMCQIFFNSYLLIDLGFGDKERGFIAAGIRLFNITILLRLIKNEKIFTHRNTFMFFPVLMIVAMLPGYFLEGVWGLPTVAGVMLASTARWILLAKYTNEVYDSKYRATAISALSMAIGGIFVIGTTASGPIMEQWGGVKTIFTLMGIITAVIIVPLVSKILKLPRYAK